MFHHAAAGSEPARKLSAELHGLAARFEERRVTLREVMDVLGARASGLLILLLALPFCAPVSIPGMSVPFGLVIMLIAVRYALGRPPWLPAWLLALRLPPRFFRALLEGASRFTGWIERRLRPRGAGWTDSLGKLRLHAAMVSFCGFLLALPLAGIPFTNTLPALVIVVGMLGMLERDGLAIAAAYGLLAVTLAYFSLSARVILELFHRGQQWLNWN